MLDDGVALPAHPFLPVKQEVGLSRKQETESYAYHMLDLHY